jgi:hypothetical protein
MGFLVAGAISPEHNSPFHAQPGGLPLRKLMVTAVVLSLTISTFATETKAKCAKLSTCPAAGCGAKKDPDLNVQKNRTGEPGSYTTVSFAEFVTFNSKAVNKKTRSKWTDTERTQVAGIEDGPGVTITAFLFDATLADRETCNCYKTGEANRDFHIWLAENKAGAKAKKFIVVEMTPLIRPDHPSWNLKAIRQLRPKSGKPWTLVRVKGYPLFDSEHWNFPKRKIRATAWEIHPVTEFSYCSADDDCDPSSEKGWKELGE